jgi:hypothetical protein
VLFAVKTSSGKSGSRGEGFKCKRETNFEDTQLRVAPESSKTFKEKEFILTKIKLESEKGTETF